MKTRAERPPHLAVAYQLMLMEKVMETTSKNSPRLKKRFKRFKRSNTEERMQPVEKVMEELLKLRPRGRIQTE